MKLQRNIVFLLLIAVTGFAVWETTRVKELTLEAGALRTQLSQTIVEADHPKATTTPSPSPEQPSEDSSSSELLRLRGEVTVLRRQLAEAVQLGMARRVESNALAQIPNEPEVAMVDLTTREDRIEKAKQRLRDLVNALVAARKLSPDFSEPDLPANLSPEDLRSYREAKTAVEQAQQITKSEK